jgi:hypothetical protein
MIWGMQPGAYAFPSLLDHPAYIPMTTPSWNRGSCIQHDPHAKIKELIFCSNAFPST